jgi:hydroxymethylpyrimidine pyrophosphatase-like HAD family hydrolase
VQDPGRFGVMPYAIDYVRNTRKGVEDIHAFIHDHAGELDGLDLILRREEDRREIWQLLKESGEPLYITSSVRNRVELSSPQAGKAAGLRFLLDQMGIAPEETAAFGDADNDIDMLQMVGWGIAMANASEGCKKAADYITRTNLEDGVAYGIREILRIENIHGC